MRYAIALYNEKQCDKAYRIYVTDSLKLITENTARLVNDGQYMTMRWCDVIRNEPVDNRSGEEVAADVMKRAGLKFGGGDED